MELTNCVGIVKDEFGFKFSDGHVMWLVDCRSAHFAALHATILQRCGKVEVTDCRIEPTDYVVHGVVLFSRACDSLVQCSWPFNANPARRSSSVSIAVMWQSSWRRLGPNADGKARSNRCKSRTRSRVPTWSRCGGMPTRAFCGGSCVLCILFLVFYQLHRGLISEWS